MAITYGHTDIQTYIHTDRQTEPKYDIDFESEWLNNDCSINITSLIDIVKKNPDYTTDCISAFSELLVNSAHMMSKPIFVNS